MVMMNQDDLAAEVRTRLIEAALTERALPTGGIKPSDLRTVWPQMDPPTVLDLMEYGEARRKEIAIEEQEARRDRRQTTPENVSHMMEVLGWVAEHVPSSDQRRAVLAWARMKAGGPPLRSFARREGIVEHTAKRRADRAVGYICDALGNISGLLDCNRVLGVFNTRPKTDRDLSTLDTCGMNDVGPTPTAWMAHDAKPIAHDDEDPNATAVAQHGVDEARRRARETQERRRRAKLGLDDSSDQNCEPASSG
jgi:hypothetical protein